ncbi:MAG: TetR/AcrR family transcriptional regulator [Bacteroidales bacterium]|nr:TetR/AcrR family transcriptional regulator [Bacteroidales bacterium]
MRGEKTRKKLIEVARQLFIKSGVEATTMNDIAVAAGKVRRTLYTHFKSKEDIYWAVVETEIMQLIERLKSIVNQDLPPEEKLAYYIFHRLELIKEIVLRNGTLRTEFFRDVWSLEHAWKDIGQQEIALLRSILQEGVDNGAFEVENIRATAILIHYALRGFDAPYIRNHFQRMSPGREEIRAAAIALILNAVRAKGKVPEKYIYPENH